MKRYLLDATPLTALMRNRPTAIQLIRPWLIGEEAATSILVDGEAIEYIRRFDGFAQLRARLRASLMQITPLPLTYATMERYAELRRQLRPPFGPGLIGDIDILIAATALVRRLTLVTTDGDFRRVPGLSLILLDRTTLAPIPI